MDSQTNVAVFFSIAQGVAQVIRGTVTDSIRRNERCEEEIRWDVT